MMKTAKRTKRVTYEDLVRLYVFTKSVKRVADAVKLTAAKVKRVLIELRSIGVAIAMDIASKLGGYARPQIDAERIDVDRLNVIIKVARAILRTRYQAGLVKRNISKLKTRQSVLASV
jgi:hypothetical protein